MSTTDQQCSVEDTITASTQKWKQWCRLCAREDSDNNSVLTDKLLATIKKHFCIEISINDPLPKMLCIECLTLIKSIINLAKCANKVQEMFSFFAKLNITSDENFDEYLLKYEFLEECIDQDDTSSDLTHQEDITKEHLDDDNGKNKTDKISSQLNLAKNTRTRKCKENSIRDENERTELDSELENCQNSTNSKCSICKFCHKSFVNRYYLQTHINTIHLGERPFICEKCGFAFKTKAALKEHMSIHSDERPYKCTDCGKSFKKKMLLKYHKETHDPRKHVCTKCGLKLNSSKTLLRHLTVHSDKKNQKCDVCGREFRCGTTLKNHMITHTNLKPFSCDFCGKQFSFSASRRAHKKRMHPKELALQEASEKNKPYTKIPTIEELKAYSAIAAGSNTDKLSTLNLPVDTNNSGAIVMLECDVSDLQTISSNFQ